MTDPAPQISAEAVEAGKAALVKYGREWPGGLHGSLYDMAAVVLEAAVQSGELVPSNGKEVAVRLDGEPEAFVWGSEDAARRVQALGDRLSALLDAVERHREVYSGGLADQRLHAVAEKIKRGDPQ